jgi:hypothetical protein
MLSLNKIQMQRLTQLIIGALGSDVSANQARQPGFSNHQLVSQHTRIFVALLQSEYKISRELLGTGVWQSRVPFGHIQHRGSEIVWFWIDALPQPCPAKHRLRETEAGNANARSSHLFDLLRSLERQIEVIVGTLSQR